MTLITEHPPFETPLEQLLEELRLSIDSVANEVCSAHYDVTQEPALTTRIATAIEHEITHHPVIAKGLIAEVTTFDIPDRGLGSMEKRTGTDLYVSLVRRDKEEPVTKGMLIQAKWDHSIARGGKEFRNQANRMRRRSEASYIWVYSRQGVQAVPAERATYPRPPRDFAENGITIGKLITDGLRCTAGDENIGRNLELPEIISMNHVMRRLSAKQTLDFTIKHYD